MWWKGALPSWLAYKCRHYEDAVPRHHSKIFCVRQWCAWSNRVSTVYKHKTIRTESAGLTVRSYPFSVTISVSLGFVCVARRFVWLAATMADGYSCTEFSDTAFFSFFFLHLLSLVSSKQAAASRSCTDMAGVKLL